MTGSFSSLNTALSGLRYQQVALDMASTNVANSTTEGYVRRRVTGETAAPGTTPAIWSRSVEVGNGVRATGVERMVDPFLDARSRTEHGKQGYLDVQTEVLGRVEAGLGEPGDSGVVAAFAGFRSALHDLVNSPGSDAARGQVLAKAKDVADAVNLQSRNLASEASDQRAKLMSTVAEVNSVAQDLASANKAVVAGRVAQNDVSTLEDTRDRLALRLAELTGGTAKVQPDGSMDFALGNVSLVSGKTANTLTLAAGVTPTGAADGQPTKFQIGGVDTGALGGQAGGIANVLDNTLPTYQAGLNAVAQQFADTVNTAHAAGYDLAGTAGGDLFKFDPTAAADPMSVLITDRAKIAASSVSGTGNFDAGNASNIEAAITGSGVGDSYQRLVSGFGITVASMRRQSDNQKTLTDQVDGSREQLAGVSLDEETVNMMTAQRAYEAAARLMTTLDSVLDTLINRTGLVH